VAKTQWEHRNAGVSRDEKQIRDEAFECIMKKSTRKSSDRPQQVVLDAREKSYKHISFVMVHSDKIAENNEGLSKDEKKID
jgi:hypothetical protein